LRTRWIGLCIVAFVVFNSISIRAQEEARWAEAENVSQSGAASEPVVVRGWGSTLQAFWWDQFDGLTTALYYNGRWSSPSLAPIWVTQYRKQVDEQTQKPILDPETGRPVWEVAVDEDTGEVVRRKVDEMPLIVQGNRGTAHAFWLGTPQEGVFMAGADEDDPVRPLLHSMLSVGTGEWSEPTVVAPSATVWQMSAAPNGRLHLVYFSPLHTDQMPAGIYERISVDGGQTWTDPIRLYSSLYVRLAKQSTAQLCILADAESHVFVSWNDPRTGAAVYVRSDNYGWSWAGPMPVSETDAGARNARFVVGANGDVILVYEGATASTGRALFMRRSLDGGETFGEPQRILKDLVFGSRGVSLEALEDGRVVLIAGGQSGGAALAVWDASQIEATGGSGWSDVRYLALPEGLGDVHIPYVDTWQSLLADEDLIVWGRGQDGDVWVLRRALTDLDWTFIEPPPWSEQIAVAEPTESVWTEPVNLSRSGTASNPVPVVGMEDSFQVFWWDRFDGLMSAYYDGEAWSRAVETPIMTIRVTEEGFQTLPIDFMPRIVGDGQGGAHAFWLQQREKGQVAQSLMHAILALGTNVWSEPDLVTDDVAAWEMRADREGTLHLLFVRNVDSETYYTQMSPDRAGWSQPRLLYPTLYARLWSDEDARLALAVDETGRLLAVWDNPRLQQLLYAWSVDGGESWSEPAALELPEYRPQHPVVSSVGGMALLLWQSGGGFYQGRLYQQRLSLGDFSWQEPELLPEQLQFDLTTTQPLGWVGERVLFAVGMGTPYVSLVAWDVSQPKGWSDAKFVPSDFQETATGRYVYWDAVNVGLGADWLIAVGLDRQGDVWAMQRLTRGLDWVFAPPSPWSDPEELSFEEGTPKLPSMAGDVEGRIHAVWAVMALQGGADNALYYARLENGAWTSPAPILRSPKGWAAQPSLAVSGDWLHLAWSGGDEGQIYYSRSYAQDAYAAGSWSEPLPLPGEALLTKGNSDPCLVADLRGGLHLLYVVPLNEGRGVYYLSSKDQGETWSAPTLVFDAADAGWAMVMHPTLAVDHDGTLYAAWVRASLPGMGGPQGIYYATSRDGGQTWIGPVMLAGEGGDAPRLVVSRLGEVHLFYRDVRQPGPVWEMWSPDSGQSWTYPTNVPGFVRTVGGFSTVADGQGHLYLAGMTETDAGVVRFLYAAWDAEAQQWSVREALDLPLHVRDTLGVRVGLAPLQGELVALMVNQVQDDDQTMRWQLQHSGREVAAIEALPESLMEPLVTPVPTPLPTVAPTATPRIQVDPRPPAPELPGLDFGLFSIPYVFIGSVAIVGLVILGVALARSARK